MEQGSCKLIFLCFILQATTLYLVPPLIHFIASHPDVKSSYFESVTLINNGAASVGLNDVERLLKKAPHVSFSQGI